MKLRNETTNYSSKATDYGTNQNKCLKIPKRKRVEIRRDRSWSG